MSANTVKQQQKTWCITALSIFDETKNSAYVWNGITDNFSGFKTVVKPIFGPCLVHTNLTYKLNICQMDKTSTRLTKSILHFDTCINLLCHLSEQLSRVSVDPQDLIGWCGDEQVWRGGETHIQGRVQCWALNIQNAHVNP